MTAVYTLVGRLIPKVFGKAAAGKGGAAGVTAVHEGDDPSRPLLTDPKAVLEAVAVFGETMNKKRTSNVAVTMDQLRAGGWDVDGDGASPKAVQQQTEPALGCVRVGRVGDLVGQGWQAVYVGRTPKWRNQYGLEGSHLGNPAGLDSATDDQARCISCDLCDNDNLHEDDGAGWSWPKPDDEVWSNSGIHRIEQLLTASARKGRQRSSAKRRQARAEPPG